MARNVGMAMSASAKALLELNKSNIEQKRKLAEKELAELKSTLEGKEWEWKVRRPIKDKKAISKQDAMRTLRRKIAGKKKHIERLARKLEKLPDKPSVFVFGQKAYYAQPGEGCTQLERDAWRRGFREARNCMFGAPGSSDEAGGNSTYRITYRGDVVKSFNHLCSTKLYVVVEFNVWSKGVVVGRFSLRERAGRELQSIISANSNKFEFKHVVSELVKNPDGTAKIVARKVTTGRTPLKVFFMRKGNAWNIYISFPLAAKPQNIEVKGCIGVDTNHGHFDSYEVAKKGFAFQRYAKNAYDVDAPSSEKKAAISAHIRKLVFRAYVLGYAIVLENLDFEYAKTTLMSKLGATLHTMPYKALAAKFRRECARMGVPFRLVSPEYTSLWGNILATLNCRLSRDVAAAGVIALHGLEGGAEHFQKLVAQVVGDGDAYTVRINEKNKCGRHVKVVGVNLRQMDSKVPLPTGVKTPLRQGGVLMKGIAKAASSIRRAGRIICQSRSDGGLSPREGPNLAGNHKSQTLFASRCRMSPLCSTLSRV
jgi:IS605 OrfB family transposase